MPPLAKMKNELTSPEHLSSEDIQDACTSGHSSLCEESSSTAGSLGWFLKFFTAILWFSIIIYRIIGSCLILPLHQTKSPFLQWTLFKSVLFANWSDTAYYFSLERALFFLKLIYFIWIKFITFLFLIVNHWMPLSLIYDMCQLCALLKAKTWWGSHLPSIKV